MTELIRFEEDFLELYRKEPRKIIAYGAGKCFENNYDKLPQIECICDKNIEIAGKTVKGIKVCRPEELCIHNEEVYIVVFTYCSDIFWEIYEQINKYAISAKVTCILNNIAFTCLYTQIKSYKKINISDTYTVNLVCGEQGWILRKFADRMKQCLEKKGIHTFISTSTMQNVDINHHIQGGYYKPYPNDTLMLTHLDDYKKLEVIKKQLTIARMGICMSRETLEMMKTYGIPANKLCYINPAHDSVVTPKKYRIGITHRCYDTYDVRKRADVILDIVEGVSSDYFCFIIMGRGWERVVSELRSKGFDVQYYNEFDYDIYVNIMQDIDYFLYTGFDEGSMGYLDALAAGAGTIVTPQGFHLDVDCDIDYPCKNVAQFRKAFTDLQKKREAKINAVREWTWDNYVKKHMEIWDYILMRKDLVQLFRNQLNYEDGIYSMLIDHNKV
ncbi:MAG: hypothetical protein K2N34_12690 [Lachnospiraceae bacterium]|nr:hypothetical protein [Lachnospiraceae bacterium]